MIVVVGVLLIVAALVFTLGVRTRDLPEPEPVSPTRHLEEKKARIYEGLRDLNFEYRVGKLSDADYQRTKAEMQGELSGVLAEIDKVLSAIGATPVAASKKRDPLECPHCGAKFEKATKYCGACGKEMSQ